MRIPQPYVLASALVSVFVLGCGQQSLVTAPKKASSSSAVAQQQAVTAPAANTLSTDNMNGAAGQMPAYYDDELFTINFMELPDQGEQSVLHHNKSLNQIYMSDPGLPEGKPFISVLDAIQGDGFNPLWEEVQIRFTEGHTPRQLTSDTEIDSAHNSGEIALIFTGEVYRCSVVGPKK
jgi:hypothetical protein